VFSNIFLGFDGKSSENQKQQQAAGKQQQQSSSKSAQAVEQMHAANMCVRA